MISYGFFLRKNWALAVAVIVLVGTTFTSLPAVGQQSIQGKDVSAVGPALVVSITPEKIALAAAHNNPFVIDLQNKTVVAKDETGRDIPLTAITPGISVGVLNEASRVTIRVAPKTEVGRDKYL